MNKFAGGRAPSWHQGRETNTPEDIAGLGDASKPSAPQHVDTGLLARRLRATAAKANRPFGRRQPGGNRKYEA